MSQPIRCGILGTGHAHASGKYTVLRDSHDWELVGACEPDEKWRTQHSGGGPFSDAQWVTEDALLSDDSVRMIAIESEVPQLLELGQKAIDAGKHIHLDKPAGACLGEFKQLLDEAERKDLIVQMGYMYRYNEGFDLLRRALREGWLGEVHYLHGTMNSSLGPETRETLAFHPGGMVFELACHLLDMLVLLMGRPTKVTPFLRHDASAEDSLADNTVVVLEFERAAAVIESSAMEVGSRERRHFEVCGSKGSIVIQPLEAPEVRLFLAEAVAGYAAGWQKLEVPFVGRYNRDLKELARCVRGELLFPYSYEHDHVVQETVLRASSVER